MTCQDKTKLIHRGWNLRGLKKEIKEQKTINNPKDYQKEDLKYNEKFLDAVETMLKHYTVRSEWPEELKDAENG